jgi:signal transduction histidine kinase/DNA-binding NarL/FixJ family response regulator/HPt (histidine-containing phosphotransfer) domain-containing protein
LIKRLWQGLPCFAGVLSFVFLLGGCGGSAQKNDDKAYPVYTFYRDIPGVTDEEIQSVENLRNQVSGFSYGMIFSTEAFYYTADPHVIGGYAVRFCQWLTDLFGIPFIPRLYTSDALTEDLENRVLDFTGELTQLEGDKRYYMTDPIARRVYKTFRVSDNPDTFNTEEPGSVHEVPRYGFLAGSPSLALIPHLLKEEFTLVTVQRYEEVYRLLKNREIDLFFADETREAIFDIYKDLESDYFFPQIYRLVGFATQNPELIPIISIVQKYLEQGALYHLVNLYDQAREDYQRYRFLKDLTEEEIQYLEYHHNAENPVKIGLQYDNYPVSFYNEQENQWQGIVPDILDGITTLTGLTFSVANTQTDARTLLLDKLEQGEVSIIAELIHSRDRESRFIWADKPYLQDQYVLLSQSGYPDVSIYTLGYARVGLVADSIYAQSFKEWFPQHRNFVEYSNYLEGFDALEQGYIDLFMVSSSLLLMITNYYERPGFKVNFAFDLSCDSQFGFNKHEMVLKEIITKAQEQLNTDLIVNRWSRRVFDYRSKLARAQIPYLIGVSVLLATVLLLLTYLLVRTRQLKMELEKTVQKRTQELEVQTNLAKAASKAKSRFLASMSHEIRTPMNAIIGMSDLMGTGNLDEVQLGYFLDIKKMAKALLTIINDILDFSKIEAGKMEIVPVHYNLLGLYDNICSMNRFTAMGKDLEFRHSFDPEIPDTLYGDEVRVRQVITNILSNAVKYTSKGYVYFHVQRTVQEGKDYIVFMVEDTGRGIKQEDFPKIFGAFQQVDSVKNRGIVGTGLGLTITKMLVDMMGGYIMFDSEYGKGSLFKVYLPLVDGDPGKIERLQNTEWIIAKEGAQILVVDDNSINLTVALGFLATHKISADTALSGIEAIERVQRKDYDIVFMDHMMPEMDGLEATQRIRNLEGGLYKILPIIALSANAVSGAREAFLAGGMNDFISKPIDAEELNKALTKWLPSEKVAAIVTVNPKPPKGSKPTAAEPDPLEPLFKDLEHLEGLNLAEGLRYVNNSKPAYIKILRQFCIEADAYIEGIRQFAAEENWKEYAVRVHGMKGAFANIGVEALSKEASKLEYAAKNNDYDRCRAETGTFCEAVSDFKEALLKTSLKDTEKSGVKTRVDKAFLTEKLDALEEACMKGLSDKADLLAAELGQSYFDETSGDLLKKITELVETLDYDMALEQITMLREHIV